LKPLKPLMKKVMSVASLLNSQAVSWAHGCFVSACCLLGQATPWLPRSGSLPAHLEPLLGAVQVHKVARCTRQLHDCCRHQRLPAEATVAVTN
jgi:hypothetical protein